MKEDKRKKLEEEIQDTHDMDQSSAFMIDHLPPLWYGLYKKCRTEGFDREQAMELVKVYINTTLGVGRYLQKLEDLDG
jgi:hypothetical protein